MKLQNQIIVVGCTKKKKTYPCIASEMYSESTLFKKTTDYINSYYSVDYLILSAKYGIIHPRLVIEPYDICMKDVHRCSREYSDMIQNIKQHLGTFDKIITFCGQDYVKMLRIALPDKCITEPLKGMGIGQRLQFLTERCC